MTAVSCIGDFKHCAGELRRLADDLERIATGDAPTPAEMKTASLLKNWRPEITERGDPAVSGIVSGHSAIIDGTFVFLEIVAADSDLQWLRSGSSWFVLGEPAAEREASQ